MRVRNDVAKNEAIALYTPGQQIEVMRALKHTLDPNNILNPGKLLPSERNPAKWEPVRR